MQQQVFMLRSGKEIQTTGWDLKAEERGRFVETVKERVP